MVWCKIPSEAGAAGERRSGSARAQAFTSRSEGWVLGNCEHPNNFFLSGKTLPLLPLKMTKICIYLSSVSIMPRSWHAYLYVGPFFPTCFRSITLCTCQSENAELLRSRGLVSSVHKYITVCPLKSNLSCNHSINPSSKQTNVSQISKLRHPLYNSKVHTFPYITKIEVALRFAICS